MSIDQLESVSPGDARAESSSRQTIAPRLQDDLPDLEAIPLHVRNVAALRGLGYSFRQIGQGFGVSPQAASIMLSRQRALMKSLKTESDLAGLSPRAINCLGRLGIRTRAAARAMEDLPAKLQGHRNCGVKTVGEILAWAAA